MKAYTNLTSVPSAVATYSPIVQSGNLLFLSGQIGIDPGTGKLVEGGVRPQCEQVLKNLEAVLKEVGSSPASIVMTTVFLTDMADYGMVNELYGAFVNSEEPPARQAVAVKELPLAARIEISAIAELSES